MTQFWFEYWYQFIYSLSDIWICYLFWHSLIFGIDFWYQSIYSLFDFDLLLLWTQTLYLLLKSWISTQQLVQNKITFLTACLYIFIRCLYYYIERFFIFDLFANLYNLVRTGTYLSFFYNWLICQFLRFVFVYWI